MSVNRECRVLGMLNNVSQLHQQNQYCQQSQLIGRWCWRALRLCTTWNRDSTHQLHNLCHWWNEWRREEFEEHHSLLHPGNTGHHPPDLLHHPLVPSHAEGGEESSRQDSGISSTSCQDVEHQNIRESRIWSSNNVWWESRCSVYQCPPTIIILKYWNIFSDIIYSIIYGLRTIFIKNDLASVKVYTADLGEATRTWASLINTGVVCAGVAQQQVLIVDIIAILLSTTMIVSLSNNGKF